MRQGDEELAKGLVQFVPSLSVDTAEGKKWVVPMRKDFFA